MLLSVIAVASLAVWLVLLFRSRTASKEALPDQAARGRRLDWALLVATLVASFASCAAPIVPLVSGFEDVANAPPPEKTEVLRGIIERDRPLMPLALLGISALGAGVGQLVSNWRRARRGAGRSSSP